MAEQVFDLTAGAVNRVGEHHYGILAGGYEPYGISPGMQALPEIRAVTRLDGAERVKAYASHVQRRLFGRS